MKGTVEQVNRLDAIVEVSGARGVMPILLYSNTTQAAATAAATAQTLMSYSLPAGALNEDGRSVRIRAVFSTAATTNVKTFIIKFGSTIVATSAASAFANSTEAVLEAVVTRTGAATQDSYGTFFTTDTTSTTTRGGASALATPTETLSAAVTIAVVGTQGSAAIDIFAEKMEVWLQ